MGDWLRRAALAILLGFALLLSIVVFRFVKPPITTVMMADKLRGMTLHRQWVPLEHISPNLPLAVIASEDGRFCVHWGVDWGAMREAIQAGGIRGASTIPMQVAKNLYLWNGRSYVAQGVRAAARLCHVADLAEGSHDRGLSQRRRVRSRHLRRRGSEPLLFPQERADLTRHEAVLLAATLPNPQLRNPRKPSLRMLRIARAVELRMPIIAKRSGCVHAGP